MIVNSTELQNNFGKYLMLAAQEEIIVTRNGTAIAKLLSVKESIAERDHLQYQVMEKAQAYDYDGRRASYEEFLTLTRDTEDRYEYIDGKIYLLASPKTTHQMVLTELFVIFYNWFQGSKCKPFIAPYDITLKRTPDIPNVVQPDLMVICDLEDNLNAHDYYMGVPTLVVEVLSEGTRRKDILQKLDLYMSCGISEYWIVNPLNREVTVYHFKDNNFHANTTYRMSETANSYVFEGLSADLDRIFQ